MLSACAALIGCLPKPIGGSLKVSIDSGTIVKHEPDLILGARVPRFGGHAIPAEGTHIVLGYADRATVGNAKPILRIDIAALGATRPRADRRCEARIGAYR